MKSGRVKSALAPDLKDEDLRKIDQAVADLDRMLDAPFGLLDDDSDEITDEDAMEQLRELAAMTGRSVEDILEAAERTAAQPLPGPSGPVDMSLAAPLGLGVLPVANHFEAESLDGTHEKRVGLGGTDAG